MIHVAIPAYNEENLVASTIEAATYSLREAFGAERISIWVVDDGSADKTASAASAAGARVMRLGANKGKGRALRELLYRTEEFVVHGDDVVLLLDADLGVAAREAPALAKPVVDGACDMAIAAFPPAMRKGGFGFVKRLAARAIEEACGFAPRSPVSGQRALAAWILPKIEPAFAYGFGLEVAMTLLACEAGARILEVETDMRHRETGRDLMGFLHRFRQYRDIKKVLKDVRRDRKRSRSQPGEDVAR